MCTHELIYICLLITGMLLLNHRVSSLSGKKNIKSSWLEEEWNGIQNGGNTVSPKSGQALSSFLVFARIWYTIYKLQDALPL